LYKALVGKVKEEMSNAVVSLDGKKSKCAFRNVRNKPIGEPTKSVYSGTNGNTAVASVRVCCGGKGGPYEVEEVKVGGEADGMV
jgi:hypothetical protein